MCSTRNEIASVLKTGEWVILELVLSLFVLGWDYLLWISCSFSCEIWIEEFVTQGYEMTSFLNTSELKWILKLPKSFKNWFKIEVMDFKFISQIPPS